MEIWRTAWPFLLPAMLPGLLLVLAAHGGARGRTMVAAGLLALGLFFVGDVLLLDHSGQVTVPVVNVFPGGPDGAPRQWVVAEAAAPAWHWHIFIAAMLALAAAVVFVRRHAACSRPLVWGTGVFWYYLALRLGLEWFAAGPEIAWATGATPVLFVVLPFFAADHGRAGHSLWRLLGACAVLAWLQRLPLIAFAWFATTRQWGTHLDTHRVTEVHSPLGRREFGNDAVAGWIELTLVPHLTLWVAVTVVLGLVLGVLPWALARRRANGRTAASG